MVYKHTVFNAKSVDFDQMSRSTYLIRVYTFCLMNVCQRKSSRENYKLENAPMVVRRSDTRTPSKPPLKTSTYQQSRGNRLHRIETSEKGCWWIRSKKNQRSRAETCTAESQSQGITNRAFILRPVFVLSATGSAELRLVSSAILEHTNNNTSHSWLGLVIVSNDRRKNNTFCQCLFYGTLGLNELKQNNYFLVDMFNSFTATGDNNRLLQTA